MWLAHDKHTGRLVGFCGFLEVPSMHEEPLLVYALFGRFAGVGYGAEMAVASIAEARRHSGFSRIAAGVDEVNVASLRILEKLGFRQVAKHPGRFGSVLLFLLEADPASRVY